MPDDGDLYDSDGVLIESESTLIKVKHVQPQTEARLAEAQDDAAFLAASHLALYEFLDGVVKRRSSIMS